MLVLTRKRGEQITIGDHITITVTRISGDRVKLGIDAPPDVEIWRAEVPPSKEAEGDDDR